MRSYCHLLASIGLSLAFTPGIAPAQRASDGFVRWAATHAIPVRTDAAADSTTSDLLPLRALVGRARVVAYGEPTHGAHEPLAFRNRLFRFLVEHMGFTAIAIESGLTESEAVDSYVNGAPGELRDVVARGLTWGFGSFGENEELIAWMREYNANPAHTRKLHFYGIDLTGGDAGGFPHARRAIDAALAGLRPLDSAAADSLQARFAPLLDRFDTDGYASLSPAERERLSSALDALAESLTAARRASGVGADRAAAEWALRNAAAARQLERSLAVSPPPATRPGIPPDAYRATTARDSSMAENVRWALEREGPEGRVLVYAHNAHVMNSTLTGGPWSAYRERPSMMGTFLRTALGDDLAIIGSATGSTAKGLPPAYGDSTSVDVVLSRVGSGSYAIDVRRAREDPAAWRWLTEPRTLRANITTFAIVAPAAAFDVLVYIDTLTPSRN